MADLVQAASDALPPRATSARPGTYRGEPGAALPQPYVEVTFQSYVVMLSSCNLGDKVLHGLYHWGKLGRPRRIQYVIRHGAACLYYVYWCFTFFPSLPVTASASCRVMLCVYFATSSNRFWNFRPSWTGTARSHGRKTGGKGHCRLLFWKLLSFWICWPGQPEVAAGVARRCLQTIAAGVARRLKKCDTSRACKDIDGLIGDALICWLTLEWMADWLIDWLIDRLIDWLIDWLIYWEVDRHLTKWLIEWFIDWLFHEWLNALFAALCNQVTYRSFFVVVISSSGPEAYMLFLILKWLSLFKISNTWMHCTGLI